MNKYRILVVLILASVGILSSFILKKYLTEAQVVESIPLIPRNLLFGNPDKINPQISLDGKYISYVAPLEGVLNIWIEPVEGKDIVAHPITFDKKRGIRSYVWAYDHQHILYVQDDDGDENWNIFSVHIKTGELKNLTRMKKVVTTIVKTSPNFPEEIIIGMNNRDPQFSDYYRLNIRTGAKTLLLKNEGFMGADGNGVVFDDNYQPRIGATQLANGGARFQYLDPKNKGKIITTVSMDDVLTTFPLGYSRDGHFLYWLDSRNRNTSALIEENIPTRERKVLAENSKADIQGVWFWNQTHKPFAAVINYQRYEIIVIDPAISKDFETIGSFIKGDPIFISGTMDGKLWIIADRQSDKPTDFYLYNRLTRQYRLLFNTSQALAAVPLQKMHPTIIKARDGLEMVGYYTLPSSVDLKGSGKASHPVPMILYVHGGPWARDEWGLDKVHQWLANRGYAVLSVNYRGSTGFGKDFINAGNLEWGAKMQTDLVDAVQWAIQEKIAFPHQIVIMGGSYGGYATLAGLTLTPDLFAGGIDMVGISNLETWIKAIPPYWKPLMSMIKTRIGNPDTEEGVQLLKQRSPFSHIQKIKKPLLIGQGANDPRVVQVESDQMVQVMKEKKTPVTYLLYPDEGHGFVRPENRLSFYAVAEAFLSVLLKGRVEPVGDDFRNSSIKILEKDPHLTLASYV